MEFRRPPDDHSELYRACHRLHGCQPVHLQHQRPGVDSSDHFWPERCLHRNTGNGLFNRIRTGQLHLDRLGRRVDHRRGNLNGQYNHHNMEYHRRTADHRNLYQPDNRLQRGNADDLSGKCQTAACSGHLRKCRVMFRINRHHLHNTIRSGQLRLGRFCRCCDHCRRRNKRQLHYSKLECCRCPEHFGQL